MQHGVAHADGGVQRQPALQQAAGGVGAVAYEGAQPQVSLRKADAVCGSIDPVLPSDVCRVAHPSQQSVAVLGGQLADGHAPFFQRQHQLLGGKLRVIPRPDTETRY